MFNNRLVQEEFTSGNLNEMLMSRLEHEGVDVMVYHQKVKLPLYAIEYWSNTMALELHNKGINPGDFVALYLPPGFALCATTMALAKLGVNQMLFRDNLPLDFVLQQADGVAFKCLVTTLPKADTIFDRVVIVDPNESNLTEANEDSNVTFEGGHFFVEEFYTGDGVNSKYLTFESSEFFVENKMYEYSDSLLFRLWIELLTSDQVDFDGLDTPFWEQQINLHLNNAMLENNEIEDETDGEVSGQLQDVSLIEETGTTAIKGALSLFAGMDESEKPEAVENLNQQSVSEHGLLPSLNTFVPEAEKKNELLTHQNDSLFTEKKIIDKHKINTTATNNNMERIPLLIKELKEILEEASGIEMAAADENATLIELGLDSLFLTQVSITLSKRYNTKITFRQLNEELSSIQALALYIDNHLPADNSMREAAHRPVVAKNPKIETTAIPSAPVAKPSYTALANTDAGTVEWLIAQQMQIMQQQLALLSGANLQPNVTEPTQEATPAIEPEVVKANEPAEEAKPFGAIARIEKTTSTTFNELQEKWFHDFVSRYNKYTQKSKAYTQQYRINLADPRVVTGFKPYNKEVTYQVVVNRSKGSRVWDIDGNEYVDILNGFGSNMFGHSPDFIVEALQKQLEQGYEVGPQHPLAGELADLICELTGSERAALCNTGSEAVLGALRMARTVTGKSLVVAFNNSYHGINDEVIVRGTKKLKSMPAAAGIMPEAVANMLILDYGTPESLQIIHERIGELAAILVEPVQSRMADFHPKEFIKELRKLTSEADCALIFDEVITGFRYAQGGAQEYYGVKADIATYGKVCGGGMPIGAMAGKRKYMDALDGGIWQFGDNSVPESGVTYFAGTFVRHPFALAAGVASLKHLKTNGPNLQQELNSKTRNMVDQLNSHCASLDLPIGFTNFASLFKMKYKHEYPFSEFLFHLWRMNGVHVLDGFPCFLTTAHTQQDIQLIVEAFKKSVAELVSINLIPHKKIENGSATKNENLNVNDDSSQATPPLPNARLGKDQHGKPAWFVPDPSRPGKFMLVQQ